MNSINSQHLMTQAEYAKKVRPMLPAEAFQPDYSSIGILFINLAILALGWGIADNLDQWHWYWLWLYLPLSLIMGNSVIVLLFSTHNLMHSSALKNPYLRWIVSMLGMTMLWNPPTFWKAVHNREHHNKTNSFKDPDRNYLAVQPNNWGKWIQNLFAPSSEVNPLFLVIGLGHAWGVHNFRNLTSLLFFNNDSPEYPPTVFQVNSRERRAIALELLAIIGIHIAIISYLDFHPVKLLLAYFIPIWIGHGGAMFYIYTNHLVCRMTDINDPLINSLSIKVHPIFNALHFNFSYHTEHHVFPGMNSDYYPLVQKLLQAEYPDRHNLLGAIEAWRLLLETPRHYRDENTFTDWDGEKAIACPLSGGTASLQELMT